MHVRLAPPLLLLMMTTVAIAADSPTPATAPATTRGAARFGGGIGGDFLIDRANEAVAQLQLSDEQRTKIDGILKEARVEFDQMRTQLESMEPRDRMGQVREFLDGLRGDISATLNDEQRVKLRQKFEQMRQSMPTPPGGAPPTPPANPASPETRGALAQYVQRAREGLATLDLSQDQKDKVHTLLEDVRGKADKLRKDAANGAADARDKARELMQETREKLAEILTPQQRDKLREFMSRPAARRERPPEGDAMMNMTGGDAMVMTEGRGGARRERRAARDDAAAVEPELADSTAPPKGPAVGDAAPDFTLKLLNDNPVQLSSLKGRVVVLVFGSYSAPTFRNRAPSLEKLKSEYGTRATFYVVYTREAHPSGEWEVGRNKADGVSVEQTRSHDARKETAATARTKLKLTTPILLDTPGNDTAVAYGAGPNSAVVVGRDGTIAAKQQWFEPLALRRAIDEAAKQAVAGGSGGGSAAATRPAS